MAIIELSAYFIADYHEQVAFHIVVTRHKLGVRQSVLHESDR
jgi:hypothetical protein